MELANIERLLEAYFEGNTSLEDEQILRNYFTGQDVAPHLKAYASLFEGFTQAQQEQLSSPLSLPEDTKPSYKKWLGIAASAVIVLMASVLMYQNNSLSAEEEEALLAYNETKKALILISQNLNKGTEELAHLNQFTQTKNKYFKQ